MFLINIPKCHWESTHRHVPYTSEKYSDVSNKECLEGGEWKAHKKTRTLLCWLKHCDIQWIHNTRGKWNFRGFFLGNSALSKACTREASCYTRMTPGKSFYDIVYRLDDIVGTCSTSSVIITAIVPLHTSVCKAHNADSNDLFSNMIYIIYSNFVFTLTKFYLSCIISIKLNVTFNKTSTYIYKVCKLTVTLKFSLRV